MTSEDEDGGEKHTYQLVDAEEGTTNDNALFTISGTTLKTNQSFDYEAASEYSIRVQVTDRNKLTYTQTPMITHAPERTIIFHKSGMTRRVPFTDNSRIGFRDFQKLQRVIPLKAMSAKQLKFINSWLGWIQKIQPSGKEPKRQLM